MTTPLLFPTCFPACLSARPLDSHKGTFGCAGLLGGASGMRGALLLAARSALYLGSGKVFAAFLDEDDSAGRVMLDPLCPELMMRLAADIFSPVMLSQLTAIAIGPGLGQSALAVKYLQQALAVPLPLVIDADALNLIAIYPDLQSVLRERVFPTVLTPHPAEAARLLGVSTDDVQKNRPQACADLVRLTGAHVVLKGRGSLVGIPPIGANSSPVFFRNTTGNPGMASAGMGDVLTGMVAALLAQGKPTDQAVCAAVYLHGQGADDLVSQGIGPIGLTASEVALAARKSLNQLVAAGVS